MKSYIWEQTASTVEIMLDWPNIEGAVVKSGTPISRDGKVANDETAVGILVDDAIFVNSPMRVNNPSVVLIEGVVDIEGVEADCGLTISDAAKAAMRDIIFTPVSAPVDKADENQGADNAGKYWTVDTDGGLLLSDLPFEVMENQADSEATTIAALKTDFNTLLAALVAGGFMAEPDPEPEPEPDVE